MKKHAKKLRLSRETICSLDGGSLSEIHGGELVGGSKPKPIVSNCKSCHCQPTTSKTGGGISPVLPVPRPMPEPKPYVTLLCTIKGL